MAWQFSMGEYYPADSPLHRLDPRTKIVCSLVTMIAVFFVNTSLELAIGFAFMLFLICCSKVPFGKVGRACRPVALVILLLSVFNLLFTREGAELVHAGPIIITTGGVTAAYLYSLRLFIGLVAALVLLYTTTPTQITDGADALLSPLNKIGLPGHALAMIFSLMLRYIPTIAEESVAISDAQRARGAGLDEGSLLRRLRAIISILTALLASSVHHASNLSRTLDARCYSSTNERSHWHPLAFHKRDAVACAATASFFVLVVVL